MTKPTKTRGAACNVSTDKSDVSKRQYDAAQKKASARTDKAIQALAFLKKANRQRHFDARPAEDVVEYQPPHISEYPAYGEHCWYEAWLEMTAWLALCIALDAYERARRATYMPPWALQQYLTTLMTALDTYNAAWYGLDNCLHGTPT
jgi:hypothetical protein